MNYIKNPKKENQKIIKIKINKRHFSMMNFQDIKTKRKVVLTRNSSPLLSMSPMLKKTRMISKF